MPAHGQRSIPSISTTLSSLMKEGILSMNFVCLICSWSLTKSRDHSCTFTLVSEPITVLTASVNESESYSSLFGNKKSILVYSVLI